MIAPETVAVGIHVVRAEESWIPVLFGGMIPIVGAGAVLWLIWHAVRDSPEDDDPEDDDPEDGEPEDGEPEDEGGGPDDSDPPPR